MLDRVRTDLPEAALLAAQGCTMAQIARRLNVSFWTIRYWAQRNDVTLSRYKHTLKPDARRAIDLAKSGLHAAEIARQTGYTAGGVSQLLRRHGIKAGKCAGRAAQKPTNTERAEKMAGMYRQGLTLAKIGEHYGLTRERVRQIIRPLGVLASDKMKSSRSDRAAKIARMDAASMLRWGVPHAEMKKRRADRTIAAFEQQRNSANHRGIKWELPFADWLAIWVASGKLARRGRGKGRYVMSRIKDEGGYVLGNVHVQLSTENNSEGLKKCRSNKAKNTGVLLMYPNLAKGWVAKAGHTFVGLFASEEEAVAARAAYLKDHPIKGHRGYGIIRNRFGKETGYQVQVGKKYIGTYRTPEAALAARAAAEQAAPFFAHTAEPQLASCHTSPQSHQQQRPNADACQRQGCGCDGAVDR